MRSSPIPRLFSVPSPVSSLSPTSRKGIVDLVRFKAIVWTNEDMGANYEIVDIPADLVAKATEYREKLVEAVAELDDAVMEAYFAGEAPSEAKLKELVRKGCIGGKFVPVLCGSAFKNKGVQTLLDAVVDYLPSPLDKPPTKGSDVYDKEVPVLRKAADEEPFSGLAFKARRE